MTQLQQLEDRKAKLESLIRRREQIRSVIETTKANNGSFFFKPYPYQNLVLDNIAPHNVVVMPSPNKLGKSCLGANIVVSWCLGFEPWSPVESSYEGAVKYGSGWYKPSSLGIKPPVKIRITGEDWLFHIAKTIIPELKKWAPSTEYVTKKNNVGVEYLWDFKNKSTIELMTYDQDDALFEGWLGHGWWADEPPPRSKYTGMARGLFMTGGKVLMSMTPLKEAWVLDELMLSGRPDVWYIPDLSIWDNPDMYGHDVATLRSSGLDDSEIKEFFRIQRECCEKEKPLDDAEKYLEAIVGDLAREAIVRMSIHRFILDIPIEERFPRLFGTFKALVGLVLKTFNPNVHVIEPFKVPTDWMVTALIDIHLNKPQAVSFFATDPNGRNYIIDEIWENLSPEAIADEIARRKRKNMWRLTRCEIDPLSRGDSAYVRNRLGTVQDSYDIIAKRLSANGIMLRAASKDKDSGVRNLNNWLKGVNGLPTLYVFNTCKMHLWQISRWVYDDQGKPKKEHDDFPENMYRFTLMNVKFIPQAELTAPLQNYDAGVA